MSRSGEQLKGILRILTVTSEKQHIQDLAPKRRPSGTPNPNLGRKSKHVLQNSVNRQWNVWFRFYHPWNRWIYRVRWQRRWCGLLLPVTWAKRFCTAKISNKEGSEILCLAAPRNGPGGCHTIFLRKWPTCWIFCLPESADTAVIEPTNIVLKSPHPGDSGSSSPSIDPLEGQNQLDVEESLWFLAWDCQVTVLTKDDGLKLSVNISGFEVNCQITNVITLVTEIIPPWASPAHMQRQVDVAVWKDTLNVRPCK
jgi:hypothetical protein